MKVVRFSQNGHTPRLGRYVPQDEIMDLAASASHPLPSSLGTPCAWRSRASASLRIRSRTPRRVRGRESFPGFARRDEDGIPHRGEGGRVR